jgi:hypothetical protein
VCTNFGVARFKDLPREHADKFFAAWADHVPIYKDYWTAVEVNWRARNRFFDHLKALIDADRFEITLRPHPREDAGLYKDWIATLPAGQLAHFHFDDGSNISGEILACDLELSCESCTTAVESWILGKPTVELVFDRHPAFYLEDRSRGNVHCDDPAKLADTIERELKSPIDPGLLEARRHYLEKWCATPDGSSCRRLAGIAAGAVRAKRPADWSKLGANDLRRAAKLHAFRMWGLPYHYDPLLTLKHALMGKRYAVKQAGYAKSIKPRDVAAARVRLGEMQ